MSGQPDRKQLRHFGSIVGGIFGVLALWPLIVRGQSVRWWMLGLAVALLGPALVAPRALGSAYRVWMVLGDALGWVNTRLVLGLIFFGVVTPTGVALRMAGHDPLRRAAEPEARTYRVSRVPRPGTHMTRQF
jgi:hypothetical protein